MNKKAKKFRDVDLEEQGRIDKTVEKWLKKNAIKDGDEYFDHVIYSLKGQIEEARKAKKSWKTALTGKPQPNGYVPEKNTIIQYIEWNMHRMEQTDFHNSEGARAMVQLANAFKIQL